MNYQISLSNRAAKDLDRLPRGTQERILNRLDQLAEAPCDPRLSSRLTNQGGLRKSRVGGWRIIFSVNEGGGTVEVVTIERRGQVYQRI